MIALVHDAPGLRADAVLVQRDDVSALFGITRSYFQADLETVGDAVVFLRTLLPKKPVNELYTVLGRAKQGQDRALPALLPPFRGLRRKTGCWQTARRAW